MMKVIEGIEAGDLACVRLGIEFIEEDAKFPFGKTLKSNAAVHFAGHASRMSKNNESASVSLGSCGQATFLTSIASMRGSCEEIGF